MCPNEIRLDKVSEYYVVSKIIWLAVVYYNTEVQWCLSNRTTRKMSLDKKNTIKKQKNKESDIENQTRTMDALRGQGHLRKFMPLYLN